MKFPNDHQVKEDPIHNLMNELAKQAPLLIHQAMNREKRCKLTLELTTEDLFKVSEFMVKNKIGKIQVGEMD